MRFFDAHCDTVLTALDEGFDFLTGKATSPAAPAELDLPRLLATHTCVQIFAIFMAADNYPPDGDFVPYAERALQTIHGWAEASGGRLRLALTAGDIRAACSGDGERVYGLIGLEGADCLEGKAENLRRYYAAGVRNVISSWGDNAFSGAVLGGNGPLTAEGGRLMELCEELRVMVDVSHLSDSAFWQVYDITQRPFVASHSDCRALSASPRNLTDDMIRALAGRGGVMGVTFASDYLSPEALGTGMPIFLAAMDALRAATNEAERERIRTERDARLAALPRPGMEWIAQHVKHAIQIGGEDCVGLGGDLDGSPFLPAGMSGIESYPAIPDLLLSAGLTEAQIEKVCWRNMARVYVDVLPQSAATQP